MGRRTINRMEKRAEYEASERLKEDVEEEVEEELEEEEEEGEEREEGEEEGGEGEAVDEEEVVVKKPAKKTRERKPRTPKITRMKVIWGVFNNSHQRVASYDYPKRKEAEDHAAKLTADKKSTHFVQPVKEPLEEKK